MVAQNVHGPRFTTPIVPSYIHTTLIFLAFTRIISVSFGGIEREVEAPENAEKVA